MKLSYHILLFLFTLCTESIFSHISTNSTKENDPKDNVLTGSNSTKANDLKDDMITGLNLTRANDSKDSLITGAISTNENDLKDDMITTGSNSTKANDQEDSLITGANSTKANDQKGDMITGDDFLNMVETMIEMKATLDSPKKEADGSSMLKKIEKEEKQIYIKSLKKTADLAKRICKYSCISHVNRTTPEGHKRIQACKNICYPGNDPFSDKNGEKNRKKYDVTGGILLIESILQQGCFNTCFKVKFLLHKSHLNPNNFL